MKNIDLTHIYRTAIGFDQMVSLADTLFDTSQTNNNWPPYNILKEGEDKYIIALALAGFSEKNL